MATCAPFNDQLLDLVYGVCDESEAQALRAHLEVCPACREALVRAQAQRLLVGRAALAVGADRVPVFHRPAEGTPPPATVPFAALPFAAPVRAPRYRRWLACAAAAAVLLAGGTLWHLHSAGRVSLENVIADHRQNLRESDAQLAALKPGFEAEARDVERKLRAEAPLQLYVMSPAQLQSAGGEVVQVATRDLDGKPVNAKVTVTLQDVDTNKVLARHEAAAVDGMIGVPLGEDLASALQSRTMVQIVAEAQAGPAKAQVRQQLRVAAPAYVAHLATNKTVYRPGELLFFRALVLDRAGLTPPLGPIALRFSLLDANGRAVGVVEAQAGPGGVAAGELAVTDKWADGNYELRVAADQPDLVSVRPHTRTLQIARDLNFDLQADRDVYKPGDTVNMLVPRNFSQAPPAKGKHKADAALAAPKVDVTVDGQRVEPLLNAAPTAGGGFGGGFSGGFGGGFGGGTLPPGAQGQGNIAANLGGNGGRGLARNDQTNLQFNLPKNLDRSRVRVTIKLTDGKDGKVHETFEQDIAVVPSKLAVDFFPEGGELVAGVANRVCYRVRSPRGEAVNPEGRVIVLSGSDVLFDSTPGEGTGSFSFLPKVGESYAARITTPGGATTEFADPFARMGGVRADGLVLHVPQPVASEGAPLQVILRNPGAPKRVLLVADCRGRFVAQQWVEAKGEAASVALGTLAGARGLVRLTAYEAGPGVLKPLAERLVYRIPAQRLDLSALHLGGVIARAGQKSVHLEVRVRDQNGVPKPAWVLAAVIDERFRTREPSLLAHFFIAGDVSAGEDLDDAVLLAPDTAAARHALDLFLGTIGWRRVEAGPGKIAPAAAPMGTGFVGLENASLKTLQQQYADRVEEALAPTRLALQPRFADLTAARLSTEVALNRAVGDLRDYDALPQQYFRVSLGVATLLLLALAVGMMATGAWRLIRRRQATPLFAGTFACLGLCIVSMLVLSALDPPIDLTSPVAIDKGPRLPDWVNHSPRFGAAMADPPIGPFADATLRRQVVEREGQPAGAPAELRAQKVLAELPDSKTLALANSFRSTATQQEAKAKTVATKAIPPPLAKQRWLVADAENRKALDKLDKGEKAVSQSAGGPPGVAQGNVPMPAALANALKEQQTRRTYSFEYVVGLEEDTLLWHPALFLANGSAQVAFDVPASAGTYRVLLLGHTPDGRLGAYEGRLEVQAELAR